MSESNGQVPVRLVHIEDGFTVRSVVPETDFFPTFEVEFRPMVAAERVEAESAYSRELRAGNGGRAVQVQVAAVTKHLVKWSVENKLEFRTIERLESNLLQYLFDLVTRAVPAIAPPKESDPHDYLTRITQEAHGKDTIESDLGN